MTADELGIIVVGALAGWWLVSWIIDKARASREQSRNQPPAPDDPGP